jgi:3-hydroxybutyryl-CoA dehydrogenase
MEIRHVGVVGAGFMGSGIAQVCAQAGYRVTLIDLTEARLERGLDNIEWSLGKLHDRGEISESPTTILGRIAPHIDVHAAHDAQLIIEAVFETLKVKLDLLEKLDSWCEPYAIIGSNTSTIPITRLSEATRRPEKVIGIHFFGPVPMMRLVEVIPNPKTAPEVVETVLAFGRSVGKRPVLVKQDIAGFLMNRIYGAMVCEAIRLVERGAGTIEDIDQGMCDGFNMRVGPLCIADLAGLDIALNAFNVIHELDPGFMPEPPELLKRLVREGKLGAKSGEGFYKWAESGKRTGPAF